MKQMFSFFLMLMWICYSWSIYKINKHQIVITLIKINLGSLDFYNKNKSNFKDVLDLESWDSAFNLLSKLKIQY